MNYNNIFDINYLLKIAKEIRSVDNRDIISAVMEDQKKSMFISPNHKISIIDNLIQYKEETLKKAMEQYFCDEYGFIKFKKENGYIVYAYGTLDDYKDFSTDNLSLGYAKDYEEIFKKEFGDSIKLDVLETINNNQEYDENKTGLFSEDVFEYLKLYFNLRSTEEKRIIDYLGIEEESYTNKQLNDILSYAKRLEHMKKIIEETIEKLSNIQYCFTADTHLYKDYPIIMQDETFTVFVESTVINDK